MAWTALLGLFLWSFSVLLSSPCMGVADNLDYWRVMRPAGIEHVERLERPGEFVRCSFAVAEADLGSALSSASVMAWIARHTRLGPTPSTGAMDLRQVGVLYLLVTLALVARGLGVGLSPWLAAALVYVLTDPGYLLFFNSFYADPALFVALLGTTFWFSRIDSSAGTPPVSRTRQAASGFVLAALALLGGGSKMQYLLFPSLVLVALLSLVGVRACRSKLRDQRMRLALPVLLLVLAILIPVHFFYGPAPRFLGVNNYHAVYAGLLQVSDRPEQALQELQIPLQYRDLPRKDVWAGHVPLDHPVHDHLKNLSRWKLLRAYLSEPRALGAAGSKVERNLASFQSHTRGSFVRSERHPRREQFDVGWRFARLRALVVDTLPGAIWLIFLGTAVWLATSFLRRSWNGGSAAALFLLLFAASQLVVVILGDGFVALKQHLIGARLALDLLSVLLVWEALTAGIRRLRQEREVRPEGCRSTRGDELA